MCPSICTSILKMMMPVFCLAFVAACDQQSSRQDAPRSLSSEHDHSGPMTTYQGRIATAATETVLKEASQHLPIGDFLDGSMIKDHTQDILIAPLPTGIGAVNANELSFGPAGRPASVHPSTYANVKGNYEDSGLFKVADGFYQIRGDLSQITLVRGTKGWIVIDAGTTREFSSAAWEFAQQHLPGADTVPISTIIYSHSHVDHFGGVKAFVSQQEIDAGQVEIIAPYGFMQEALAENVIAGSAMLRRAQYHFGPNLDAKMDGSELFYLSIVKGEYTLLAPTLVLPEGRGKVTTRVVDGITFEFKDISSAEAPAATIIFLPKYKMLFNSELFFRGLHNIYTLRGARVRDALAWSKLINEVIQQWGDKIEMTTGPHGPSFSGNEKIIEYMKIQRDNYGFIHNQALRLINSGMKMQDVGQAIEEMVPESLSKVWHTHGYHGTYSHNARGVVNRYIGFYDGNPANLNPLQIKPEAVQYVDYMGGSNNILEKAKGDFSAGKYRFVATIVNKLVTAEPNNWPARHLLADTYEQLGYQSEGPQWRNAYLSAAKELRTGTISIPEETIQQKDMLAAATIENILDSVAVRINAPKAAGKEFTLNFIVPDTNEIYFVELSNSNLSSLLVDEPKVADTTVTIDKKDLLRLMSGTMGVMDITKLGFAAIEGSPFTLVTLIKLLQKDDRYYDMVPMPSD